MKNNILPKINMSSAKQSVSKFNLSHDHNTTFDWGSLQPLICREVLGGSETNLSVESLVRLAPMVAPCFGRMNLQLWHNFVAFNDLLPHFFPAFESQMPYSMGIRSWTPTELPSIPLNFLSALCLAGAKVTNYSVSSIAGDDVFLLPRDVADTKRINQNEGIISSAPEYWVDTDTGSLNPIWLDLGVMFDGSGNSSNFRVPLNNFYNTYSSVADNIGTMQSADTSVSYEIVTPESADAIYFYKPESSSSYHTCYCFRMSSFGKRLRKILIGLGYQFNLNITTPVSLMPLFAWYKSYFDVFGLTLYQGYETTNLSKVLSAIEINCFTNFASLSRPVEDELPIVNSFMEFIQDVGHCWYTSDPDFVSAHTSTQVVSPSAKLPLVDVSVSSVDPGIDIAKNPILMDDRSVVGRTNGNNNNNLRGTLLDEGSHAAIGSVLHGALDEEYLKRLYVWTNRNTVAGREIEKLLRAQGLGAFVDSTKPHFIGHTSLNVRISDVTATSNSTNAAGAAVPLGDYTGKGIAINDDDNPARTFTFENDETGYIVTMAAMVPDSGFTQSIDPALFALNKFARYNPEFDGVGVEATRKSVIFGSSDVGHVDPESHSDDTFGFIPRYSGLKVAFNKLNGDFSLRGTRSAYLPYTVDRVVNIDDLVRFDAPGQTARAYHVVNSFGSLPNATPNYRFTCRYPWLSNFNRIFANSGSSFSVDPRFWLTYKQLDVTGPMMDNEYDNFLCHNIINFVTYEHKLALSDSFETVDEDKRPDMSISKA